MRVSPEGARQLVEASSCRATGPSTDRCPRSTPAASATPAELRLKTRKGTTPNPRSPHPIARPARHALGIRRPHPAIVGDHPRNALRGKESGSTTSKPPTHPERSDTFELGCRAKRTHGRSSRAPAPFGWTRPVDASPQPARIGLPPSASDEEACSGNLRARRPHECLRGRE